MVQGLAFGADKPVVPVTALAAMAFRAGLAVNPEQAIPVYLRDDVAVKSNCWEVYRAVVPSEENNRYGGWAMVTPIWQFRRMHPGELNIDPIEAEFFSTEALGSLADAFVRESVQNSIDARLEQEPVRIRFLFPPPTARIDGQDKEHYLPNLWRHLGASGTGLTRLPSPNEPLDFIVIEDFGTRGLQGDPHQSEDEESDFSGPRNDFYYWVNADSCG